MEVMTGMNINPIFWKPIYAPSGAGCGTSRGIWRHGFAICLCFQAKMTVSRATVTIKDSAAYGIIMMQGHGKMGVWDIETPALIRYGQLTNDEFFISEQAALEGVRITNHSTTDPIVMLKHFGPENPDMP